ncbi:MAG: hypothetical protein IT379_20955 [Deltaproteobacteria bacterium]|nr:hypothetical protein [Deltaproteobacteria bacterium]
MHIPWTRTERRWLDELLAAIVPGAPGAPAMRDLDLADFHARLDEVAPLPLRVLLRAGVWGLELAPPLVVGRLRTFSQLDATERDAFVRAAARHRAYPIRQLVETLKLLACFAYFRGDRIDPSKPLESRRS